MVCILSLSKTGTGLKANEDFSRYTILHPIGTFALKDASQ